MTKESITEWIINDKVFSKKYTCLLAESVSSQFESLNGINKKPEHDWNYLLLCASVLASGETNICKDIALRICQHCLASNDNENDKASALYVLNRLANHQSIRLSEEKNFISSSLVDTFPLAASMQWSKERLLNTIWTSDGRRFDGNKFQKDIWGDLNDSNIELSISAPTSAGKSFIVKEWIQEFLNGKNGQIVVYIVPTRALITEVESDLRQQFEYAIKIKEIEVSSVPTSRIIRPNINHVYVLTPERLSLLFKQRRLQLGLLIIDEAYKIGDGNRGILLQHVIETAKNISTGLKTVYLSPLINNPEVMLSDALRGKAKTYNEITVNQNILWVSSIPKDKKGYKVELCYRGSRINLGRLELDYKTERGKYVSTARLAYQIGKTQGGTVIYANRACDTEAIAECLKTIITSEFSNEKSILFQAQFEIEELKARIRHSDIKYYQDNAPNISDAEYDKLRNRLIELEIAYPELMTSDGSKGNIEIDKLIELCKKTVHDKYILNEYLKYGIAFHYGNMPLLIKTHIERLFKMGIIKFLICTSTLVEGVNLPCKNILISDPKKGAGNKMPMQDFWNLAGRAGRWGKEFQGNIFCVEPHKWDAPESRGYQTIIKSTLKEIRNTEDILNFIESRDYQHINLAEKHPNMESLFSYLTIGYYRHGGVKEIPWIKNTKITSIDEIASKIDEIAKSLDIPKEIIERNPGISPISMNILYNYFKDYKGDLNYFIIPNAKELEASTGYEILYSTIHQNLSRKLGHHNIVRSQAILTIQWMRGYPLKRIIQARLKWTKRYRPNESTTTTIRNTLDQLEEIPRFLAPKFVSCYVDVLKYFLKSHGFDVLYKKVHDISLQLELGVNSITHLSLIQIGLSRTTVTELYDGHELEKSLIKEEALSTIECITWLKSNINLWRSADLPILVKDEIEELLKNY